MSVGVLVDMLVAVIVVVVCMPITVGGALITIDGAVVVAHCLFLGVCGCSWVVFIHHFLFVGGCCGHLSLFVFIVCHHLLVVVMGGGHHLLCVLVVVVLRKEATSHNVTLASHLSFHVSIISGIFTFPMEFCQTFHRFCEMFTECDGTQYGLIRHNN